MLQQILFVSYASVLRKMVMDQNIMAYIDLRPYLAEGHLYLFYILPFLHWHQLPYLAREI